MRKHFSIIGKHFGRWHVIKYACKGGYYLCRCKCGTEKSVRQDGLISGRSKSCGCYMLEEVIKPKKYKIVSSNIRKQVVKSYSNYVHNAKDKRRKFNITIKEFQKIILKNCYYCNGMSKRGFNGLDRVNNKKGYIKNNVVPCCDICNQGKHTMTKIEFYNWIKRVYDYLKRRKR